MTKTVVFSDMHNRDFCAKDLFHKIGLMDEHGNRVEGFKTIQLGDLLSLGYGEQEAEFLQWVRPFIDVQLIGNHELPAVDPYGHMVEFNGWEDRDLLAEQMMRKEFVEARNEGSDTLWIAATHVGKWLITHAGLSIAVQKELGGTDQDAATFASKLNDLYVEHVVERTPDPIFISAGEFNGGIFWLRLPYLRAGYRDCHVPQIVGHTPFDNNQKFKPPCIQNKDGNLWGIDTGITTPGGFAGSIAALVTEDEGENWELVQSDYWTEYGSGRVRGNVFHKDQYKGKVGIV